MEILEVHLDDGNLNESSEQLILMMLVFGKAVSAVICAAELERELRTKGLVVNV
jgi:hypothetical protein